MAGTLQTNSTNDLPPEEQRFLAMLAPSGLNWITTRDEFRSKYGITVYNEWAEVIQLPPTTAISNTPLSFYMYWNAKLDDLPPEYLFADYMPHKDARKNHAEIEAELISKLGEGKRSDVSNCLVRVWSFGIFKVELLTWPPELQHPSTNTLHEKNPDLTYRSAVTIKSELGNIFPAKELLFVAEKISGKEIPQTKFFRLEAPFYEMSKFANIRHTRRNPAELISEMKGTSPIAWKHEAQKIFGITGVDRSIVFTTNQSPTSLINYKIAPARGPGGSELQVHQGTPPDPTRAYECRTTILTAAEYDAMDDIAARLGNLWNLSVQVDTGIDD